MNILEHVVEYPDGTGYVNVEKAYSFGSKYLLIVSTGENGNSCPATTYAIAFDSNRTYAKETFRVYRISSGSGKV